MPNTSCPCCGRAYPKAKAAVVVNTAELSEKDLFAHYKRTAPVEDVKFRLRLSSLSPDVRQGFERLLVTLEAQGGKATTATKHEYLRLDQLWRQTPRHVVHVPLGRSGWSAIRKAA